MTYDQGEPPFDPPEHNHTRPGSGVAATAAERALLGALLATPHAKEVADEVTAADFYHPAHAAIWDAIHAVANTDTTPDPVTVATQLTTHGDMRLLTGGPLYLHTLMAECPVPGNATAYAKDVRDNSRLRTADLTAIKLRQAVDKGNLETLDTTFAEALQTLDDAALRFGPTTSSTNTGLRDLEWVLTGQPPTIEPPRWGIRTDGHALFYDGMVNGLFGDPESAKTWLAQCSGVEALNDGGTLAMLDVDHNGANHTVARLMLLGARPQHLADPNRFRYYEPEDADQLRAAITDICDHAPTVLIIDSLGEVFPMLGASSNDPDEATSALRLISRPARPGTTVITIDHLPKSADARSTGFAIGAIAKKRAIRGSYLRCEATRKPAPGQIGRIDLTIEKDTNGKLRESSAGGHAGRFVLDSTIPGVTTWQIVREEAPKNDDGTFRPTSLMEKVSRYVEDNDQATFRDIKEAVTAKDKWLRDAINILVTEGFMARFPGARNATLHHSISQYREAEDDHLNPTN